MSHSFIIQKKGTYPLSEYSNKIYLYPYARYAFFEILEKANIKTIYLPAFICRDMLAPINSLKIKYFFYEVDSSLNPILENIKCDAIVMVNYFGFEQTIDVFTQYKEKFGAIIIEDNAHGLLSRDTEGKLLGTRGDVGLLSIRKTVFLPNGGALVLNNKKLYQLDCKSTKIEESEEDLRYKKKLNLKKAFFSKYIGILFLLFRRYIRYIKTGSSIPLPDPNSEIEMPSNKFLTPLLKDQVIPIEVNNEIQRRRSIYLDIESWAKRYSIKPIYSLDEYTVPFEFAFIDNGTAKEFEQFLLKKGYFILPWPDLPDEVVDNCPSFYKNIKVVPFLW